MDVSNKYFDAVINKSSFYIVESSNKPKEGNAIQALRKIEHILKNKLKYESTIIDNYSSLTEQKLYTILKEKAVQIHKGYVEKKSGLLINNEKKVNAVLTRIENLVNPPIVWPLHDDATNEIIKFLDITDVGKLAQVNRHGKQITEASIIKLAKELGYSENDNISAAHYLNKLIKGMKDLVKSSQFGNSYYSGGKLELIITWGVVCTYIPSLDKPVQKLLNMSKNISPKDLRALQHMQTYDEWNKEDHSDLYPFLMRCVYNCFKKNSANLSPLKHININKLKLLHIASDRGFVDMVTFLLSKGFNPDEKFYDYSALHIASKAGNKEIVSIFINNKANINATASNGDTSLALAINNGRKEVVRLLLEHGAKPNDPSALFYAVDKDDKESVQLMKEHGADLNLPLPRAQDQVPLQVAISQDKTDMVRLLLELGADVNLSAADNTSLIIAIMRGKKEMVQLLLENGANANTPTKVSKKSTPLQWASAKGDLDIVRLLFNHSVINSINAVNADGSTALLIATSYGHQKIVQLLLEKGADPNIMNTINKHAPLHRACRDGKTEIVKLLVNSDKTNINLRDGDGESPLSLALKSFSPNIIEILKNRGAKY